MIAAEQLLNHRLKSRSPHLSEAAKTIPFIVGTQLRCTPYFRVKLSTSSFLCCHTRLTRSPSHRCITFRYACLPAYRREGFVPCKPIENCHFPETCDPGAPQVMDSRLRGN